MTAQTDAVRMLWDRQSVWSQAADGLKRGIVQARLGTLALTLVGAVFGTVAAQLGDQVAGRVCAAAAAVTLALVTVTARGMSRTAFHRWTRARSVAEAIKGDIYTYLSGVTPFRGDDHAEVLLRRHESLMAEAADLVRHTAGFSPRERPVPDISDINSYAQVRARSQIDRYYRPKALEMFRRTRRLTVLETGLAAVSAVLAAIASVFPAAGMMSWIAVLTTASAAVTAHMGASRYDYQQIEFTRTADELARLLAWRGAKEANGTAGEAVDDEFVEACERIISIQNEAWMVRMESATESTEPSGRGGQPS